jgi:hypothetical protein
MTPSRSLVLAATISVLALALAPAVQAYKTYAKWGTLNVLFHVNPANRDVSLSAAISAVQAAMGVWNTQSGTPFRFSYAGQVNDTTTDYDGKNVILFRNSSSGGAIASTYSWWTSDGTLVDSDVIFWDGGFTFFTGSSGCTSGVYIEDVGAHELGHAMGLSHSSISGATMQAGYATCSQTQRTLANDDIAGAKKLYGTGGSVTNSAPTVTIVSPANGTTVTAGTSVSFAGSASDTEQGNLTSQLVWQSNLDGQIGTGGSFTRALTAGAHAITATVTDSGGLTGQKTITVTASSSSGETGPMLTARGYKRKGLQKADLAWSGLTATKVDVYRNSTKIATTANDGAMTDAIDQKGSGSYSYKVCAASTATCSNQASVTF